MKLVLTFGAALGVAVLTLVPEHGIRATGTPPAVEPTNGAFAVETPVHESTARSRITIETYLADYFGDEWPAVRAQTGARKCSLDTLIDPTQVPTWDSVRDVLEQDFRALAPADVEELEREALAWPHREPGFDALDLDRIEYNPSGKVVTPAARERISRVIASLDADLRALVAWEAEALSAALQQLWKEDRITRSPFVSLPANHCDERRTRKIRFYEVGVWKVSWAICEGDFPEFDAAWAEIARMRNARHRALREQIAAL